MFSHDVAQMKMPSLNQWKDENTGSHRNIFMTKSHGKNVTGQGLNQPPFIQLGNSLNMGHVMTDYKNLT